MKYISTRNKNVQKTASQAIEMGLSADGGLFWPDEMPQISRNELCAMIDMSYCERAETILGKFLTDFSAAEIKACVHKAYAPEKFSDTAIAPVHKLDENAYVLELWHGPTCAFKDMALQILPHLLTTAMKKNGQDKTAVILVATSGDTGKAALEGFCNVPGTKVIVFYPSEGVSVVQKQQMVSQTGENVFVAAVQGNFDDCQTGVKKIFAKADIKDKLTENGYVFSSANSINWGRLVPQVVYYFSAYCDLLAKKEISFGDKIDFVVPTGNFGDILAGYVAKRMGLPVGYLNCASNRNNILTDFIHTGVYDKNRTFFTTMSPSMDILISSNLERLLFAVSGNDDAKIATYMRELSEGGKYTLDDEMLIKIQKEFLAGYTDESSTLKTIRHYYEKYHYVVDPHTAVALSVYEKNKTGNKTVILSTASPYKFPQSVCRGLDDQKDTADEWALFDELHRLSGQPIPASLIGLKDKPVRFSETFGREHLSDAIDTFLKL